MQQEKRLPILKTDFSVIDDEFNSIRKPFEDEMKRMEDEMNKFRIKMAEQEELLGQPGPAPSTDVGIAARTEFKKWLDSMNSPLVQNVSEGKILNLRFDMTDYSPEEISVKIIENKLYVQAKHDSKTDNKTVYREYNREFLLPQGTQIELVKAELSKDGVLNVVAPLPHEMDMSKYQTTHK